MRGVLHNKFHQEFRRRPPWKIDWSAEPPAATSASTEKETD